jgi:phospholipid transport system substrate-binding protein
MQRFVRRSLLALVLAASAGAFVGATTVARPAAAQAASASSFLDGKLKNVRALLNSPASPDREKKLDAELATLVDYDEMAKVALGKEYANRSKEEITEFTGILRQLIEKNYKKRLQDTLTYQITNKGETAQGTDKLVSTEAKNLKDPKAAAILIDYVVRPKGSGWIVVDIIPEGSSMAKTYNKDFSKVIKKDGWPALIKKMKDKLAK